MLNLVFWQHACAAFLFVHMSTVSVTVFLHRHQTHGAFRLHPIASHAFRFWLWLTTGTITKEWVAVHRYHHDTTDKPDDPHSPKQQGIWKVLFGMYFLYRRATADARIIREFGHGTPNDWLERKLYSRHSNMGPFLMLGIDCTLFGMTGLYIWIFQVLWLPMVAGVINGAGHYWGYRNFSTRDFSRNLIPFGLIIGGEELHNNHHAAPNAAKLSRRWFELDISWIYISLLEKVRLASRIVRPSF